MTSTLHDLFMLWEVFNHSAMDQPKQNKSRLGHKLGKQISTRRKELDITQAALAEAVGVNTETISRIERGTALPSLATLELIALHLQSSPSRLLETSSTLAEDYSRQITALLEPLSTGRRDFVLDIVKRLVDQFKS